MKNKIRPKQTIALLVEFAFNSLWIFNNAQTTKMQHLQRIQQEEITFYLCSILCINLNKLIPDTESRLQSYDKKSTLILKIFSENYNLFVQEQIEITNRCLPYIMELTKCELASRIRQNAIVDGILKIYKEEKNEGTKDDLPF